MNLEFFMWVIGIGAPALFALIGWVFTMIFKKLDKHDDKFDANEKDQAETVRRLEAHRLHAAETFSTKLEVNSGFDRVMSKLDKIDTKIDGKADKPS